MRVVSLFLILGCGSGKDATGVIATGTPSDPTTGVSPNTGPTTGGTTSGTTSGSTTPKPVAPVAVDDAAQVDAGQSVGVDVAANDSDADDGLDLSSVAIITPPTLGMTQVGKNGLVQYLHTTEGGAYDSFTYTISDNGGVPSNVATVNIEIIGTCATVDPKDFYYDRFEGTGYLNGCKTNQDCMVGGCSGEVCAAEAAITTCEALPTLPGGTCGCVQGECIWSACL